MNDQQINQAIAEACGWTEIHDSVPWHHHKLWGYPPQPPGAGGNAYKYVPDYCIDLNAMHEAERVLINYGAWETYRNKLICIFGGDAFAANARERAETFLRTLKKWEEVQG